MSIYLTLPLFHFMFIVKNLLLTRHVKLPRYEEENIRIEMDTVIPSESINQVLQDTASTDR